MAISKQTTVSSSLNPFRETVVKLISASISYNANGRSVYTRTLQTADGKNHTFTETIDGNRALQCLEHVVLDKDEVHSILEENWKDLPYKPAPSKKRRMSKKKSNS